MTQKNNWSKINNFFFLNHLLFSVQFHLQWRGVSSPWPEYSLVCIFFLPSIVFFFPSRNPQHSTTIFSPPGVSYFNDCPQQPHIPNYLLGLALITLLTVPFFTLPWESSPARPHDPPKSFESCLMCLISLFSITWLVAGMKNITNGPNIIKSHSLFSPLDLFTVSWGGSA